MKTIAMMALLSISVTSFAIQEKPGAGILEFAVQSGEFAAGHIQNVEGGSVVVDYDNSKVSLFLREKLSCAKNMLCGQQAKTVSVELPIAWIQMGVCGIRRVTAMKEEREALKDKRVRIITVEDATNADCLVGEGDSANYETQISVGEKVLTESSTMKLKLKGVVDDSKPILKYTYKATWGLNPVDSILTVNGKGQVVVNRIDGKTKTVVREEVVQLSKTSLEKIKKYLATVPLKTKLFDDRPEAGTCTNQPVIKIAAYSKGEEIQLYQSFSCHTYRSRDGRAASLIAAVLALVDFSK